MSLPSLAGMPTHVLNDGDLLLFDPTVVHSQTQVSQMFANALAFTPPLQGSVGEIRKLRVIRIDTYEHLTLAVKRAKTGTVERTKEILDESAKHGSLYDKISSVDDACKQFFLEPFLCAPPAKRQSDESQFVYTLQTWVADEDEKIIELNTLLFKREHPLVETETLQNLRELTTEELAGWMEIAARLMGKALRCLVDARLQLFDLHSRNIMLCFKGNAHAPENVRLIFVDVAGAQDITHESARAQIDAGWPSGTGVITRVEMSARDDPDPAERLRLHHAHLEFNRVLSEAFSPGEGHKNWRENEFDRWFLPTDNDPLTRGY